MDTIESLRKRISRAWETVVEGWDDLRGRAAQAITRFSPLSSAGAKAEEGARWGLLAAEMWDEGDALGVRLEVPGMEKENLEVLVEGQTLIVRGEKKRFEEHKEGQAYIAECAYGRFERALALPCPVRPESVRASYKKGVLTVILPKAEGAEGHRVEIVE